MLLPTDRSHIETEQVNQDTTSLDTLTTEQCVALLSKDHQLAIVAVQQATVEISSFISSLKKRVDDGGRLVYLGCGTSGRLGVLDAAECPPTFQSDPSLIVGLIAGGDRSLRISSEAKEDDPLGSISPLTQLELSSKDTVLGIAAGGTTPWVLGGLKFATTLGAMTGFLTCSEVPPCADHMMVLNTGPEPLTGSTRMKAGTATKLVLNIISTTLFTQLGRVYGNMMVDLRATNNKLHDRAIRIVSMLCTIDRETSASLLKHSDGDVKSAIVMHTCSITFESAKQKLDAANGNLRTALAL